MTGSVALDVVIGLVFIYLLYSLLATIIQEIIATWFSSRAKNLEKAISRMLEDTKNGKNFITAFYQHPLIKFLGESDNSRKSKPSYIKSETFSKVIIDLLKGNDNKALQRGADIRPFIESALSSGMLSWRKTITNKDDSVQNAKSTNETITKDISDETLDFLKSLWADSQGDVDRFRAMLEDWFNESMERASGWYKKNTQFVLFFIGLCLAIFFNVNTIEIAKKLEKDPDLRAQIVSQADAFIKAHPDLDKELETIKMENEAKVAKVQIREVATGNKEEDSSRKIISQQKLKTLDSLSTIQIEQVKIKRDSLLNQASRLVKGDINKLNSTLGLGWEKKCKNQKWSFSFLFFSLLGWTITALAISLGAPFWFDLLNKLMQLRSSVASKDSGVGKKTSEKKSDPNDING